jgi:large subunit ribosomal protein L2
MNPVDHPHGGRTNKGCHPRTPTGLLAKGVKTRKMRKWSKRKVFTSRIRSLSA